MGISTILRGCTFACLFLWFVPLSRSQTPGSADSTSPFHASVTLAQPRLPSRDPTVVVPLLRALTSSDTYKDVVAILGKEDLDTGSARRDATFTLIDGSHVHVLTKGLQQLAVIEGPGIHFAGTP